MIMDEEDDYNNMDDTVDDGDSCPCPVAPELVDQGVNMWHPTPRKSSCSSCSQNGSSDGSLPNGCNQDRQARPQAGPKAGPQAGSQIGRASGRERV